MSNDQYYGCDPEEYEKAAYSEIISELEEGDLIVFKPSEGPGICMSRESLLRWWEEHDSWKWGDCRDSFGNTVSDEETDLSTDFKASQSCKKFYRFPTGNEYVPKFNVEMIRDNNIPKWRITPSGETVIIGRGTGFESEYNNPDETIYNVIPDFIGPVYQSAEEEIYEEIYEEEEDEDEEEIYEEIYEEEEDEDEEEEQDISYIISWILFGYLTGKGINIPVLQPEILSESIDNILDGENLNFDIENDEEMEKLKNLSENIVNVATDYFTNEETLANVSYIPIIISKKPVMLTITMRLILGDDPSQILDDYLEEIDTGQGLDDLFDSDDED